MTPDISIIIPTYKRKESLRNVLLSLEEQSCPRQRFEVIVVDDGSGDDTPTITAEPWQNNLRFFQQVNQGAAAARNNGAIEARGEILFFLDDDIHLDKGYLEHLTKAHACYPKAVVIGSLHPYPREGRTPFQRIYAAKTASLPCNPEAEFEAIAYTDCLTGMLSVQREDFFRLGGFQDLAGDGRVAWGDVDFGCRANRQGFQFIRCCQAAGYHDDNSIQDFLSYARRWKRAAEDAVKLFQVYPETDTALPMFTDKKPIRWGVDGFALVVRKLLRQAASTGFSIKLLQGITRFFETQFPTPGILARLYQWVIGGYQYQGYRSGLVKYGAATSQPGYQSLPAKLKQDS